MNGEACGSCRFFKDNHDSKRGRAGDCLRYPPTVVPVRYPNGELCHQHLTPYMGASQWCGEYKAKDPE